LNRLGQKRPPHEKWDHRKKTGEDSQSRARGRGRQHKTTLEQSTDQSTPAEKGGVKCTTKLLPGKKGPMTSTQACVEGLSCVPC